MRAILFSATLAMSALFAFVAADFVLKWKRDQIRKSEVLEPNLVQHDPILGWQLTPGWQGSHRHHDFVSKYSIDARGFRKDPISIPSAGGKLCAVVGDSFVFGFGVNDDQTFVHLLNESRAGDSTFINCGVPGYSTDQEALLIERSVLPLRPKEILLVVYLANDIFDNQLEMPMQVAGPKPRFELTSNGLELLGTPISSIPTRRMATTDLITAVLGREFRKSIMGRLQARFALVGTLHESPAFYVDRTEEFDRRFKPAVDLFWAITQRIAAQADERNIGLKLVLLAGKSYAQNPWSLSSQYQESLKRQILARCESAKVPVIDVAGEMRRRFQQNSPSLFFPNDGHLSPEGHRLVAEILAAELNAGADNTLTSVQR